MLDERVDATFVDGKVARARPILTEGERRQEREEEEGVELVSFGLITTWDSVNSRRLKW